MLTGLRASDAPTLHRLCLGDQKVFLRLGTLLQAKLSITESALEEMIGQERLKSLLLDRSLRTATPAEFAALLGSDDADLLMADGDATEPGWRVIALADELGNPLLVLPEPTPVAAVVTVLPERFTNLAPALRGPVEGLFLANADDQRAAALETLRYAAPPLDVVGELMPMLLADGAELVRERAINLLVAAGANVTVIDLVRALQRNDHPALGRLAETLPSLPPMQRDVACHALLAAVGRGQASQVLIDVCTAVAAHFAGHIGLGRLLELLLPTRLSLVGFVRAVQAVDSERIGSLLERALGLGVESDVQALVLIAGPGCKADDRLIERGLDLLLSPAVEPRERMPLAAALRRLDADSTLPARIAKRGMGVATARDTAIYWLLAEYCRDGSMDKDVASQLGVLLRRLLREGPGPHLVSILENQLTALIPASDAVRSELVEPIGEMAGRFRDERSRDLVLTAIASIGVVAIEPLWRLLEEHAQPGVRLIAISSLPELLIKVDAVTATAAVKRLLARLSMIQSDQYAAAEQSAVLAAAARVATAPVLDADGGTAATVDAAAHAVGDLAIEAFGWLAASRHIDPARRVAVMENMLTEVTAELPDTPLTSTTDAATQDVTFVIDDRLGQHTERIPRLLLALHRMGCSPTLPPQLLRRMVDRLCHQWSLVSSWAVVWGPGNVQELGKVLGLLAQRPEFPGHLRVKICETLIPRISQLAIARNLARIFAVGDGSYLSDLAGKAADTLLGFCASNHFADDEYEDLGDVLVEFLGIPHLGNHGDMLRRRLAGVLSGMRNRLPQRARNRLRDLLPSLDPTIQQRVEWA